MGSSPEARFKSKAKSVIENAIASQADVTKQLQEQTGAYLEGGPQNYGEVIDAIANASGRSFPEYVKTAENRFFNTADTLATQGRQDLRNFKPGLLDSGSSRKLTNYLTALGQDFASGVQQVGEAGRDRLFALPEQARVAFTESAQNPAFENIKNEQYMQLAKNPPTIQNDAMNMYRSLFTYNV